MVDKKTQTHINILENRISRLERINAALMKEIELQKYREKNLLDRVCDLTKSYNDANLNAYRLECMIDGAGISEHINQGNADHKETTVAD